MPIIIPLTSDHIQRLQDALLAAYDLASLRRMVRTQLDEDLERIVPVEGRTLTDIVYDLIRHYAAESGIPRLLSGARAGEGGNNPELVQVEGEFAGLDFESLPLPQEETRPVTRPGRSLLVAAVAIAAVLLVAGLLWFLWPQLTAWWTGPACAGNPLCAVVARVAGPDPAQADELTAEIAQQIRDVLGQDQSDSADRAEVVITSGVEDPEAARTLAADEGALLVVWGRILQQAGKLRVHFELADLLGVGEAHGLRTLRAEPLLYDPVAGHVVCANCFDITAGELGQRIAIVAHAAAGLLHYADRPEQAFADFMAALYCAGEEIDPELQAVLQPVCARRERSTDWNPALLHYYAGKSAVLSGNYAAGIALLQVAAAENKYDPAAPLGIGAALQSWTGDDKVPEAVAAFDDAVARIHDLASKTADDADRAALYHDLGLIYELQGDWPSAADNYAKAVEVFGAGKPSAYVSLIRLGYALEQGGDLAGAETRFQQALSLGKNAPWAYLELANLAWAGRQDRQAAEEWLRQAEQAAPNTSYVQLVRAELCAAWEDVACTKEAYQAALDRRPNSGWLHGRVGEFYLPTNPVRAGQSWDKAAEHYGWAVDLRPQDPWSHERLAYVLSNQGRPAEAADHYTRAIALTYGDLAPARLYCSLAAAQECAGMADATQASRGECERRGGEVRPVSCPASASPPPTLPP
jgi:tetratricopeptide (TPR) repeat protein